MTIDERQLPPSWDRGLDVQRDADGAIRRVVSPMDRDVVLEVDDDRILVRTTRDLRREAEGDDSVLQALIDETLARMRGEQGPLPGLCCSFCAKSQTEVRKLIAGPSVYICDECVDLCAEIVAAP